MAYSEDVSINLNVLTGTMSGITAIMGGMSALTSSFGAMGTEAANAFGTLDGLIVSATGLMSLFSVQSAKAFGEYEQGLKIVQTVSNQTTYAMQELTSQANQMSVEYRTAIGDINDGLQTLGRAGLNSVNEQLEVLESGLQTAKLEGRNLNGVLEEIIQNTAMLGGDLKSVNFGDQAEYLNSLMVSTSMTAPINSHDISQTLQYAGGTAAAAGANLENKDKLEDLMGTVAAFAQKGVKGSMAGTALRAFFTKPASQDKSVVDALSSIGLSPESLWEDGGESMKSVSDQVGIIQRKMDALNLSTMEQVELWGKIVGPKMGQQMMKLDSSTIKEITRDIESAKSADELAQQTLYTYNQKLSEMQQQGEMAYREFGEHVAQVLTPAVEVITKILGLLSDPHVNMAAFATVGALLSHGFQKAWAVITSVFNQIRGLIGEARAGIQSINSLAGGSAPGFSQSVNQVSLLNSKLAQTNSELAMMQAKFMKLSVSASGSPVLPLGIVGPNGKVPANMIGHAPQNVLRMGGVKGEGRFYDPSEEKQFRQAYQEKLQKETNAKVDKAVAKHYDESSGRYRGGYGVGQTGQFIKKADLEKHYSQQFALSKDAIQKQTDQAVKTGSGSLHSGLMSMTRKEYTSFMKDLNQASKRLADEANYVKGGRYVDEKGRYTKAYHEDQMKSYNLERQREFNRNARKEGGINRSTVGGQTFYRANKLYMPRERMYEVERAMQKQAQLNEFEKKRANVINQQQARAYGAGAGISNKAQQAAQSNWQKLSNSINTTNQSLSAFKTKIQSAFGTLDVSSKRIQASMSNAMTILSAEVQEGGMTFEEALIRLSEITGLTAEELTVYSKEFQGALFTTTGELNEFGLKLAQLGLVTAEGEVAEESNTAALIRNTAAQNADTGSHLFSSFKSGLSSIVDFMGGPFMAGMMVVMVGMQQIQEQQQKWQEKMQEAANQLSEATDSMTQAEDKIKELYSNENSSISEADLDRIIDAQYGAMQQAYIDEGAKAQYADMYTNEIYSIGTPTLTDEQKEQEKETGQPITPGADTMQELEDSAKAISLSDEEHISELKENTAALNAATYAYAQAENKKQKQFNDGMWGWLGFGSAYSDGQTPAIFNTLDIIKDIFNRRDNGFLDTNSPILTASQSDKNYAGSTELAGIFAADAKTAHTSFRHNFWNRDDQGDFEAALQSVFGNDADRIYSLMQNMDGKLEGSGVDALKAYSDTFGEMDPDQASRAQLMFKDNKEDLQKLGKQMFRYEQQYGFDPKRTAMGDYDTLKKATGKKGDASALKSLGKAKLTVTDKNLMNTVNKLIKLSDGKLSESNILAMGQLQQLQDMNQIAQEQVAPGINQTVQGVQSTIAETAIAGSNAGSASSNAGAAANNAAAIAAFLGTQAQDTAEHSEFLSLQRRGLISSDMTEDQFRAKLGKGELPLAEREIMKTLEGVSWSLMNGDSDPDHVKSNANRLYQDLDKLGGSYQDKLNTATWGIVKYAEGAVEAAYNMSNIGEYGGGQSSSGGGSGGGSGSGSDKDKDSGTKKERVDLVLCNKKEIPKLNVNLFKKPPNFTILNKNFKLRDIKINSQDKPKAIMNAIKNGIIETQKRMDPKIIQDEDAVYDPLSATDGSSTPSGTTQTTT